MYLDIRCSASGIDEKNRTFTVLFSADGGAEEARTLYLIAASDALSQVSYDPVVHKES